MLLGRKTRLVAVRNKEGSDRYGRERDRRGVLCFKIFGAINCVYRPPQNIKVEFATYSRAKTSFSALAHVSKQLFSSAGGE